MILFRLDESSNLQPFDCRYKFPDNWTDRAVEPQPDVTARSNVVHSTRFCSIKFCISGEVTGLFPNIYSEIIIELKTLIFRIV